MKIGGIIYLGLNPNEVITQKELSPEFINELIKEKELLLDALANSNKIVDNIDRILSKDQN